MPPRANNSLRASAPASSSATRVETAVDRNADSHYSAVLAGPGRFELSQQPRPQAGPGEVLVRLEGCGVCASNSPVWQGREWFNYPLEAGAPGHEGWGEVVALGAGVTELQPGQRVACLGARAFAEYMAVPAADAVPLPAALADQPFPGEAVGCAMNIFERADIRAGQNVAVIGAGFLGLLLIQLAAAAGARVYAMSRRDSARQQALACGAHATFDTEDWWGNAHCIVEATGGAGCERVLEVTGLQFALDTATELVAEYGRLVIAGYHQDGLRQVNMQKWNWRAIDVINAHERDPRRYRAGIAAGAEALAAGRIDLAPLLTHRFSLSDLDRAFALMDERPEGFIKGYVAL